MALQLKPTLGIDQLTGQQIQLLTLTDVADPIGAQDFLGQVAGGSAIPGLKSTLPRDVAVHLAEAVSASRFNT